MNNNARIKLRGHHLLCIQGFQNKGYNQSFIKNMASLITFLNDNQDIKIEILDCVDDICSFCPNLTKECVCKNSESELNIRKRDALTIDFLDLKVREVYSYLNILNRISDFLDFGKVDTICKDCEWQHVCLFYSKF